MMPDLPLNADVPHAGAAPPRSGPPVGSIPLGRTIGTTSRPMPKEIKIRLGVLVGLMVWFVVATVGNFAIRCLFDGYAEAEPAMRFTLPMLLARLALGPVSSLAAGFACGALSRSIPVTAKFFAGLLVIFFVPVQYSLSTQLPLWYHLVFLASLAPLALPGARLTWPPALGARGAA
jgi:hypothetical protein